MNELPIWPPIVALVFVGIMYAVGMWESRRFDRKYGPAPSEARSDPAE